jgi:HK97 family phage prohead protease
MYKSLKSQIKDITEKGIVQVAANAFGNKDVQGDISMPGSFKKTLTENFGRLKWFLNHDKEKLIGVPIEGEEDGNYLKLTGKLNLNKELGRDVYEDYKLYAEYGKTLEHSIGVDAVKYDMKSDSRQVTEWKMWEYSTLTAWGANERTPMIALKSMNDELDFLNIMLRKGNYTDEKFKEIELQINKLKSLLTEPDVTTQAEPIDWKSVSDTFIKTLKK